jgi:hypothetical protein
VSCVKNANIGKLISCCDYNKCLFLWFKASAAVVMYKVFWVFTWRRFFW